MELSSPWLVFLSSEKTKHPPFTPAQQRYTLSKRARGVVSKGRVYLSRHKASEFQSSVKGETTGRRGIEFATMLIRGEPNG